MLNIAITGGIGSGKTQLSDYLRSLGYTVIDADSMAREITAPGGKALPLIRERFGDSLFKEDGSLDRAAVRELIYNDPVKKASYEDCTTRLVLEDIAERKELSERIGESVIFYDIPLLYETGTEGDYDAVIVVTADRDIRKKRIMERDGIDQNVIDQIMASQATEDEKIAKADYVVYNNGTLEEMQRAADDALNTFLK